MKRDDYRREFAAFQAARAQARQMAWRAASGFEPLPARLQDQFSDLWSATTVADLRRESQADASRSETERRGGQSLLDFAETWFIRTQTRELDAELHRALTTPLIPWRGQRQSASALRPHLAAESDPAHRRELQGKLAAHDASLVDLREQRREMLGAAARSLGYGHLAEQVTAQLHRRTGEDISAWTDTCERFLVETDTPYRRVVAAHAAAAPATDPFGDRQPRRVAENLLRGFGIRPWQQTNVTTAWRFTGPSGVFRVRIPEDIRWMVAEASNWQTWRRFLGELARVQQAAWTSAKLPVELRSHGDPAVAEAWQWLFADLLIDRRWVAGALDIQPPPVIRHALLAARWQLARRAALRFVAWHGRETGGWALDRVRAEFAQHLDTTLSDWELHDELDAAPQALAQLRGAWLAAALNDWLRTKYGNWFASRRAGDDLIDLWNTGFRYTAGELAALVGVGPLTPDAFLAGSDPVSK